MQRLHIKHVTEYLFPTEVTLKPHQLLLRPREGHDVHIESSMLEITPAYQIKWQRDVFDNSLAIVDFLAHTNHLIITSEVIIQHYDQAPFDFLLVDYAVNFPFQYTASDQLNLTAFQQSTFYEDRQIIAQWLQQFVLSGMQTLNLLIMLNQAINTQCRYQAREEAGVQSPAQTLRQRDGSCRDFATLLIEVCRYLGLASRFVSGYLHAPSTEMGHASTHAWAEIYLPGTGWKGFDPTAGILTGSQHIAVAVARDSESIPPISGSFISPNTSMPTMKVNVQVNVLP